jgi:hypothetical protein
MTLTIHDDVDQGSDEWLAARRGVLTASVVGQLITPSTLKVAKNDAARTLTLLLAAERITGHSDPVYVSDDMLRGQMDEPIARAWYTEHYAPVSETGFMVRTEADWTLGYSPDGLVGEEGLIEIKSRRPKAQLATILADQPPAANLAQMHTGMLVSGRLWCDYVSWCGGMPPFVKRVQFDPRWARVIREAAKQFEVDVTAHLNNYTERTQGIEPAERIDHFPEASL